MAYLLVVVDDISQVVTTAVVGFAHAHGVVRQVDIAVIAWRRVRGLSASRQLLGAGNIQKTGGRVSMGIGSQVSFQQESARRDVHLGIVAGIRSGSLVQMESQGAE